MSTCQHRIVETLTDPALEAVLERKLFVNCTRPLFILPLIVNRKAFGLFVLADFDEGALSDEVPLLAEVMKRVSYRLQVFFLMDQLSTPL
jgi:hypothetical protein